MKITYTFMKRNLKEMLREPLSYVFSLGFPLLLLIFFQIMNTMLDTKLVTFSMKSLLPGLMMFSFTFIMLSMTLLISKDRTSDFLKRLYVSPMKAPHFIFGYAIPGIILGIFQSIILLLFGLFICLITKETSFSFIECLLLILSQIPILILFSFLGLLIGTLFSEKTAPGFTSIFITLSGLLGGAWIPLETMGTLENVCFFLPFYPSVYLGRIITHSYKTDFTLYQFSTFSVLGLIILFLYLLIIIFLTIVIFKKQMSSEK